MGYKARIIRLDFAHLVDDGEACWVDVLNPKLCPVDKLTPADVATGPDGQPVDQAEAQAAMNQMIAGLIVGWLVWDATDAADNPAPMGTPSAELVAKLPVEIITRIGEEIAAAFPSLPTP